jgi:outer membrane biogenesis lipoprotein LolB
MWRSERRLRHGLATALALTLGLGGCAVAPPAPPPAAPAAVAIDAVREWAGRFSVISRPDTPEANQEAGAGRFVLVSRPAPGGRTLELDVVTPFGQTIATARRAPDGSATMTLADGRRIEAPSLDALLERALGWPLPVERLPAWLDDRFETVLERDTEGQPRLAQDSGWRIEREPRRWALQRSHAGGTLRVVLVLDR